jgi:dTDP-4-dehydrorhamnose 3,5-epimerase
MKFEQLEANGLWVVEQERRTDERGWLSRTFCKSEFEQIGFNGEWVQHNHTLTQRAGSIRGMHYQLQPFSEIKLVRCIVGAIYDVVIDLREGSPTFLQHYGVELTAANGRMLFIPKGFAHGFQTLSDGVELLYCHSQFYSPGSEYGLHYADPKLQIKWPLPASLISEKDQFYGFLKNDFTGIKF